MSRSCRLLFLSLLVACRSSAPGNAGLQYPPYPDGVESSGGGYLIEDAVGGTDYGIEWVHTSAGTQLWFGRLVAHDPSGHPVWRLVDTLSPPAYDSTRRLIGGQCTDHGKLDQEILALVAGEDAESLRTVFSAWRADRRSRRFIALQPAGIVCVNEGYGG
jgi:hypothetical protein